ncbi:MAG TPA: FtsW/RodA/SpoVE family cell cycle protein [Phycisphaerae bacterium]|nr:FtsW/RodA/SpoVE family cell cycle protein [Phycisphaerae bacterium]
MIQSGLLRGGRHIWMLVLPAIFLCAAGVATIDATGGRDAGWLTAAARNQIIFAGVGLVGMAVVLILGYRRLGRIAYPLFVIGVVTLAWLVVDHLPLVAEQRNARRWLKLGGVQIQPSEVMKIGYVLALAWYLRYRKNYRTLPGLIAPFAITLVPMALILKQPDLGTVLFFLPVLFVMLFVAGARLRHLLVIILLGLLCAPVFWFKIRDYQRLRVTGVLLQSTTLRGHLIEHPELWDRFASPGTNLGKWRKELFEWESETGYQLVHSKTAIGSGGLTGAGLGKGIFVEHDVLLPEKHNDFIFAMIAHQWGLAGALAVILCYLALIVIGCDVATLTNDPFGRLLAVGLSTMIGVQAFTNLLMTVGLGPITGVTLPFVSAGGSSLVTCFLILGLLLSIAHHRQMFIARKPFEFDEEQEGGLPPI